MLHWRKAFRSTVHVLDEDHILLFQLFNHIESLGNLKREGDLAEVNRSIDTLLEYALSHCAREEQTMREAGYPAAELHAHKHLCMRECFIEVLRPLTAGEITIPTFVRLVRGQFIKHFMREDFLFVKWAQTHPVHPALRVPRGVRRPAIPWPGPEHRRRLAL